MSMKVTVSPLLLAGLFRYQDRLDSPSAFQKGGCPLFWEEDLAVSTRLKPTVHNYADVYQDFILILV
jgi:hypothetical protein